MIPVTHVFEWANIADKVRRNLFMEFAEVGAKHLVLTCEMILNCIQKNPLKPVRIDRAVRNDLKSVMNVLRCLQSGTI